MKTNLTKILSSALVVVLLFGAVIGIIPMKVDASYTSSNEVVDALTTEEVAAYVKSVINYTEGTFNSAEDMLMAERNGEINCLVEVNYNNDPYSRYALYINKYTGFVYYQDKLTGQILTSNPYQYSGLQGDIIGVNDSDLASQIVISYSETSKNTISKLYSITDAALLNQISVEEIANGLRVNYTIGDTVARYLLPGYITAEKFEKELLVPMLNEFRDLMIEYCNDGIEDDTFDIFKAPYYNPEIPSLTESIYYKGCINIFAVQAYLTEMRAIIDMVFTSTQGNLGSEGYLALDRLFWDIMDIYGSSENGYSLKNLGMYKKGSEDYQNMLSGYYSAEDSKISETLEPIYVFTGTVNALKSSASKIFERYINKYREAADPENYSKYSYTEMYEEEEYCGYVDKTDPKPVFRCSLEYTFNTDGSLSVRLPANSISFDRTLYNLDSITVLKYFGAADGRKDGYIFFPDGSGMILDYNDFYNPSSGLTSATVSAEIYGADNSYSPEVDPSKIVGAYREQVSMPVFGVVASENASSITSKLYGVSTVTNGYFAILEDGASLAQLEFQTGAGNTASAFCTYSPYPSDRYDLSNTLSVGGADYYTIVSDAKFNGSYITRYVMLTDEVVGKRVEDTHNIECYYSSYSGMAAYYRDYLYEDGTLTALGNVSNQAMPLYIEALGSMDIMDKFLTFPVEKSIPLTTFDNVATMYSELRYSSAVLKSEQDKYQALANAETDPDKKAEYQALADACANFEISNINFRLTGFGSGGLSSNYPTKLRWEKSCGGKKGFKKLLEAANEVNDSGNGVFGVYPDYDFMYLSYPSMFDGISKKNDVSKMIDNRYASKQVYDSISRQYVSYFTLVVSPESLDNLYSKFIKKYSKYDLTTISVSTMGSDLNSNFNNDDPINRNDAQSYVEAVLSRMVKQNKYSVMLDMGNAYTLRYATHLLNVATDSSRVKYSSYSVPFVGMILHGAINYAGKPLNYSGMPEYDLLRSIESGAALYFILCYQNESHMKNDAILNDYFGVSYSSWYNDVVSNYYKLNSAIGKYQDYIISEHTTVIGERVIDSEEQLANYKLLMDEIIVMMDGQLDQLVEQGYKAITELDPDKKNGWRIKVYINKDDTAQNNLLAQIEDVLNMDLSVDNIDPENMSDIDKLVVDFLSDFDALIEKYEVQEYPGATDATKNYGVYFGYNGLPAGVDSATNLSAEFLYGLYDANGMLNNLLLSTMLKELEDQIGDFVDEQKKALDLDTQTLVLDIQRDAILKVMADVCKLDLTTLALIEDGSFVASVDEIIDNYKKENSGTSADAKGKEKKRVKMNGIDSQAFNLYASKYSFITDSTAFDENYIHTDYTSDRGNIVLVTYEKDGEKVQFLLNYNIYTVEVKLGGKTYKLGKYEYTTV